MIRHDDSEAGMAGWTSPFKAAAKGVASAAKTVGGGATSAAKAVARGTVAGAKGVASGVSKGAGVAYRAGRWGVKMHLKAFILLNKAALQGYCSLPGPARAAALGAALTAGTGGGGAAAAPVVSGPAADAICAAMRSGSQADYDRAQQLLAQQGNIDFAPSPTMVRYAPKKTWWDELLELVGLK